MNARESSPSFFAPPHSLLFPSGRAHSFANSPTNCLHYRYGERGGGTITARVRACGAQGPRGKRPPKQPEFPRHDAVGILVSDVLPPALKLALLPRPRVCKLGSGRVSFRVAVTSGFATLAQRTRTHKAKRISSRGRSLQCFAYACFYRGIGVAQNDAYISSHKVMWRLDTAGTLLRPRLLPAGLVGLLITTKALVAVTLHASLLQPYSICLCAFRDYLATMNWRFISTVWYINLLYNFGVGIDWLYLLYGTVYASPIAVCVNPAVLIFRV